MTNAELSVSEYEQRAETTRRQLAEDLQTFNAQLTPGNMLDEVLAYTGDGSGTFMRAFARTTRDNPIPTLLIGTGCLLYLADRMGFRGHKNGAQPNGSTMGREAKSASRAASEMASGISDRLRHAGSETGNHLHEAASEAGGMVADGMERAREAVGDMVEFG